MPPDPATFDATLARLRDEIHKPIEDLIDRLIGEHEPPNESNYPDSLILLVAMEREFRSAANYIRTELDRFANCELLKILLKHLSPSRDESEN